MNVQERRVLASIEATGAYWDDGTVEMTLESDHDFDKALADLGEGEIEIILRKIPLEDSE